MCINNNNINNNNNVMCNILIMKIENDNNEWY